MFCLCFHAITPDQQSYCVNATVEDVLLMFIIENLRIIVLQKTGDIYSIMERKGHLIVIFSIKFAQKRVLCNCNPEYICFAGILLTFYSRSLFT